MRPGVAAGRRVVTGAADLHLLRLVPGSSPVHRLWAGTKLLALMVIAITLAVSPTWPAALLMGAPVAVGVVVARIPAGAAPRLPRWFLALVAFGGGLALLAGGDPTIHVGSVAVGLGGLGQWARAMAVATTVFTAAMLVSWTTPLGEVASALARLGSPLRRLRLPVDEWVTAIALALRCLPLLLDEIQTMVAARRLRARPATGSRRRDRSAGGLFALLTTVIVVTIRRAREMGEAIDARGGWGAASAGTARLASRDAVALTLVLTVAAVSIAIVR
jgi:energy-coupling factor transport system permease protein